MQPLSDECFLSQKPLMIMNTGLDRSYNKKAVSFETAFTLNDRER